MAFSRANDDQFRKYTATQGILKRSTISSDTTYSPTFKFTDELPDGADEGYVYTAVEYNDLDGNLVTTGMVAGAYTYVTTDDLGTDLLISNCDINHTFFMAKPVEDGEVITPMFPNLVLCFTTEQVSECSIFPRDGSGSIQEPDDISIYTDYGGYKYLSQYLIENTTVLDRVPLMDDQHAEGTGIVFVPYYKKLPFTLILDSIDLTQNKMYIRLLKSYTVHDIVDGSDLMVVKTLRFDLYTDDYTKVATKDFSVNFDLLSNGDVNLEFDITDFITLDNIDTLAYVSLDYGWYERYEKVFRQASDGTYSKANPSGSAVATQYGSIPYSFNYEFDLLKVNIVKPSNEYNYDGEVLNVFDITDGNDNPIQGMFYYVNYLSYRYSSVATKYLYDKFIKDKSYTIKWYASILPRVEDISNIQLILIQNAFSAGIKYYVSRSHQSMPENQQAYNTSFMEYEKALQQLVNDTNENGIIYIEKRHFKDI